MAMSDTERKRLIDQIPATTAPLGISGERVDSTEAGRNAANALMAIPGAGPILTGARALPMAGKAAGAVTGAASKLMARLAPAAPYAPVAGGAIALNNAAAPTQPAATTAAQQLADNPADQRLAAGIATAPPASSIYTAPATDTSTASVQPAAAGAMSAQPADVTGIYARTSQLLKQQAQASAAYDQPGALSNGSGAIILGTENGLFTPTTPKAPNSVAGRAAAALANQATIAQGNNETSRANNEASNATGRYGTDTQAATAAQRLAMEAAVHAQDAPLKASQAALVRQTDAARAAYLNAKTPEEKATAEEVLRALQGKYDKDAPDLFSTTVVPGVADALGNKSPSMLATTDKRTGAVKLTSTESNQAQPLPPKDKLVKGTVYDTPRGKAKWDGSQFIPA